MITFVYCCICLFIVCCQTARIDSEDYTNDSPEVYPQWETLRHKVGADILMKCNERHHKFSNITWEFKHCASNYRGVQCDEDNLQTIDQNDNEWKKLDFTKGKKKLEIKNSTEENIGVYRCLYNDSIIKIYILDIVVPAKTYEGPPPEVVSLIPSNTTVLPHTNLVIQCKTVSESVPVIRWFKECNERRCDVRENGHCYCTIPSSNFLHKIDDNVYLNKLNIHNIRPIDSGTYACLAISLYGKDYKNITIKVQNTNNGDVPKSFSLLFLIPLGFILVPVTVWLCYYRRKREISRVSNEQQKQLIKPVVQVDIVLEGSQR